MNYGEDEHVWVKVKIKFRAYDILREKFPEQIPPATRVASFNVNRYVMDLIIEDDRRSRLPLSDLQ